MLPLTFPVPTPTTHSDLLSAKDSHREEGLLPNPRSFRHWWTAIHTAKKALNALHNVAPPSKLPTDAAKLLGKLATPATIFAAPDYLYEAALAQFPGSFKLWKAYLETRSQYVPSKAIKPKRTGGRKKLQDMRNAFEDEKVSLIWECRLDGVIGWQEWKSLIATSERALSIYQL